MYQVRPGDTLWDVSAQFLKSPEHTPQLQEYNRIEDPYRLQPGSEVRIPVTWLRVSPAPAQIVNMTGAVRIRVTPSEPDLPAAPQQRLWAGSVLETGPHASATIGFADGSQLVVAPQTRIVFDSVSTYSGTGMVDTRVRLQHGRIESRVRRAAGPASRFIIHTPPATSTVRGTDLRVATDAERRQTTTEVPSGSVEVESDNRRYLLEEGQGMLIATDQPVAEPSALLPPPVVGRLDGQPMRIGTIVEWEPLIGATAYRVQLNDTLASRLVLDDQVVTATRAALPKVEEGDYVLRVRAIDARGIEGLDAIRELSLHDRPEPPFVIEPGDRDRLSPGRPRFRWTASETAASYRLQLAEHRDFAQPRLDIDTGRRTSVRSPQTLEDGIYYWRVAGRDEDGRQGPFSDIQRFEVRTGPASPGMEQAGRSTVRWREGVPEHRYHVQVSRAPDFQELLIDNILDTPHMQLDDLPRGRFYMRIREIDEDGFPGPFGPAQQISTVCWACRLGTAAVVVLAIILL